MSALATPLPERVRVHAFSPGTSSTAPALFCLAGAGAGHVQFADLAQACGERWQVSAFHAIDFTCWTSPPAPSVQALAGMFVDAMRALAPPPYRLLGHSAGAFVAYEAACLLAPDELAQLLIVDSYLPQADKPLIDADADASAALANFVAAMARNVPALEGARAGLCDLSWSDAPQRLSAALRQQGLFMPPREIALRLAHFRAYTGLRFSPHGRLPGGRVRIVLAVDPHFAQCSEERRSMGWQAGIDGALSVHTLPGDHFSMLRRPNVDGLCALLA